MRRFFEVLSDGLQHLAAALSAHFPPSLHRKLRELLTAEIHTYKDCTGANAVACVASNPQWHSRAYVEQINGAAIIRLRP